MILQIGIKLGVSPRLISERLLSEEDKEDMVNGLLSEEALMGHVQVWMQTGMRNYADGSGEPYRASGELPMSRYSGRR